MSAKPPQPYADIKRCLPSHLSRIQTSGDVWQITSAERKRQELFELPSAAFIGMQPHIKGCPAIRLSAQSPRQVGLPHTSVSGSRSLSSHWLKFLKL